MRWLYFCVHSLTRSQNKILLSSFLSIWLIFVIRHFNTATQTSAVYSTYGTKGAFTAEMSLKSLSVVRIKVWYPANEFQSSKWFRHAFAFVLCWMGGQEYLYLRLFLFVGKCSSFLFSSGKRLCSGWHFINRMSTKDYTQIQKLL